MAERIVSTSSSSSSLHEEVDEKQSTASSGGDSSSKDNGKSKDAVAKKDKKSKSSTKKGPFTDQHMLLTPVTEMSYLQEVLVLGRERCGRCPELLRATTGRSKQSLFSFKIIYYPSTTDDSILVYCYP